jgi:hypothetical protein
MTWTGRGLDVTAWSEKSRRLGSVNETLFENAQSAKVSRCVLWDYHWGRKFIGHIVSYLCTQYIIHRRFEYTDESVWSTAEEIHHGSNMKLTMACTYCIEWSHKLRDNTNRLYTSSCRYEYSTVRRSGSKGFGCCLPQEVKFGLFLTVLSFGSFIMKLSRTLQLGSSHLCVHDANATGQSGLWENLYLNSISRLG